MASPSFLDPLQMWREAVTKLENEVNSVLTGNAKSQEVVRALHQFSTVTMGMDQLIEKAISAYLKRANLPSRNELLEVAETVRRIEDKLDRLLPAEPTQLAPRPARTRRPPSAAPLATASPPSATAPPAAPSAMASAATEFTVAPSTFSTPESASSSALVTPVAPDEPTPGGPSSGLTRRAAQGTKRAKPSPKTVNKTARKSASKTASKTASTSGRASKARKGE